MLDLATVAIYLLVVVFLLLFFVCLIYNSTKGITDRTRDRIEVYPLMHTYTEGTRDCRSRRRKQGLAGHCLCLSISKLLLPLAAQMHPSFLYLLL